MFKKIKLSLLNTIVTYSTKHLFKMISEEDFLTYRKGQLIHRGKSLTDEEKQRIISEARTLNSSPLLFMILSEMIYLANKKMFYESKDEVDMVNGKMILWTVDILMKKIGNLSNLK